MVLSLRRYLHLCFLQEDEWMNFLMKRKDCLIDSTLGRLFDRLDILSLINLVAAIFFKIAFDSGAVTSHIWWLLLEVGVYFMIVPFITNGWTLGKIVRIRLVEEDRERISLKH